MCNSGCCRSRLKSLRAQSLVLAFSAPRYFILSQAPPPFLARSSNAPPQSRPCPLPFLPPSPFCLMVSPTGGHSDERSRGGARWRRRLCFRCRREAEWRSVGLFVAAGQCRTLRRSAPTGSSNSWFWAMAPPARSVSQVESLAVVVPRYQRLGRAGGARVHSDALVDPCSDGCLRIRQWRENLGGGAA